MAASVDSPKVPPASKPPTITMGAVGPEATPTAYTVTPSYSLVSEKLRRASAGSLQCSLFCGGQRCKYEVPHRWKNEDKALNSLYSHWITENVLAMARPSTMLFREYGLIDEFKRSGISTVVNLQLPWEHSKCGPGVESSGFTYQPEELMRHGVFFYNYGWVDYGVPTLESVLDMVKVVDFAVREGKVAVHCHAGLGRTGVLIACYLVYSRRIGGDEAITVVREKRPGSIQTRQQIEIVQQFSLFLSPLCRFYPAESAQLTLHQYLYNQSLMLHGYELQDLKFIPKAVHDICTRLVHLCSRSGDLKGDGALSHLNGSTCNLMSGVEDIHCGDSDELQKRVEALKSEMNSTLDWILLPKESSSVVLLHLLFKFFRELQDPVLSSEDIATLAKNESLEALTEAKRCTVDKVLTTLHVVFSSEGTLSQHGPSLASQLASLLTRSSPLVSQRELEADKEEGSHCPVKKLILSSWKL